ncbi:amino acid adenylation domain-containing protein [Candidatus Pseudoruminococcus sp.]|uniref:amino acid adenylation domain-containing protein n=1 Tax=Candidatus Pseudoruminococcus sp. TaxID=3101048 RepID=UPI00399B6359
MKNVLEFIENSAKSFPNKIAFSDESNSITYTELLKMSKAVGTALVKKFNKKNKSIAVFLDKTVFALTAFFGVAYSGNFYTVIDSMMPADRISTIFDSLQPIAIITDNEHLKIAESIENCGEIILLEDTLNQQIDDKKLAEIRSNSIDTDPLYSLFTSGSTGVPKGTVVSHRNVIAYSEWVSETFDITSETVFGSQTPFYFSMSVLDVFSTIRNGATFHIIPKKYFSFPIKLLEYIRDREVNTIYWVPSALSIVANWKALDYVELPKLKKVLFAGEVMPTKQLNMWIKKRPDIFYANLYGPTETTDICTYYVVDRDFRDDETLPIGKHCNNCDVMILTEDNRLAEVGEEGELCARGSFLAMGYYNNPEKTKEVFVQNPLNTAYPEIIYKTGDLVKLNEKGEIIYISRKDYQIKHMGYRIELGEIEAAAGSIEKIKTCVCIYNENEDKIVFIYEGSKMTDNELMDKLSEKLPVYMRPNVIKRIKQIPYNQNGKIDRKLLKQTYKDI